MSLKGSLQTVALPEVLGFLSGTSKSGELDVDGSSRKGSIWFQDGVISAVRVERGPNPVEAVFQLLRIEDGEFSFSAGATPPDDVRTVEAHDGQVDAVLEQAQQRLGEWTDIVAVVPSLEHRVSLVADAPEETVLLERAQWSLVVTIGEGRTVGQIIADRDLGEFDGCRAIKTLVEASLVSVGEPAVEEAPAADEQPGFEAVPALVSPLASALSGIPAFGAQPAPPAEDVDHTAVNGEAVDFEPVPAEEQPAFAEDHQVDGEVDGVGADDHYASLQSIVAEVEEHLDGEGDAETEPVMPAFGSSDADLEPVPAPDHFEDGHEPAGSRAALQALLDQVASEEFSDGEFAAADGMAADHLAHAPSADDAVDGLADRGPWTHNELASFDGWREEEAAAEAGFQANGEPAFHINGDASFAPTNLADDAAGLGLMAESAAYAGEATVEGGTEADTEVEEPEAPAEEPINRGLLLKFLSSVRN